MESQSKSGQRKQWAVKAVLTQQDQERSSRFSAATDLLLADVVRSVMESRNEKHHGKPKPTR